MTFFGPPGWSEFPAMFALLVFLAFFATRGLQYILGLLVDDRPLEGQAVGGAGAAPTASRLRVGDIPRGDHVYLVACAHGVPALSFALTAGARAEGWLSDDGKSTRGARPRSEMQRRFFDYASGRGAPSELLAVEFAQLVAPELLEALRRQGLARSDVSRWGAFAAPLLVGVGLIAWGVATAPTGGDVAGLAVTFVRGLLYTVTALAFLGLAVFGGLAQQLTPAGERYLEWLEEATKALRDDVKSGALREHDDVVLAAAVDPFTARAPS